MVAIKSSHDIRFQPDLLIPNRFCCNGRPDVTIESEWSEMTVLFRSNYSPVDSFNRRGFRAVIHAVPDGEVTPPSAITTKSTEATTATSTTTSTTTAESIPVIPVNEGTFAFQYV